MWVNAAWICFVNCVRVHCVAHTCVFGGWACVALCLVLTHPAINCVSTAAVCIGQIESSATGPFCFSPLGWASRPPHSHWSQPSFSFFFLCLFHSFPPFFSVSLISTLFLSVLLYICLSGEIDRLVSGTRGRNSFTCCSFLGLANIWHMCSPPSSPLLPPFPMCLHEKGIRDQAHVSM